MEIDILDSPTVVCGRTAAHVYRDARTLGTAIVDEDSLKDAKAACKAAPLRCSADGACTQRLRFDGYGVASVSGGKQGPSALVGAAVHEEGRSLRADVAKDSQQNCQRRYFCRARALGAVPY